MGRGRQSCISLAQPEPDRYSNTVVGQGRSSKSKGGGNGCVELGQAAGGGAGVVTMGIFMGYRREEQPERK